MAKDSAQKTTAVRPLKDVVAAAAPLFLRGEGALLFDGQGEAYLNLNELNAVLGENNPRYHEAMRSSLYAPVSAVGQNIYKQKLVSYLAETTRGDFSHVHFTSSGSEAVEWAVRLAQKITGRAETVCFWHSIHGRTALCAGMSGIPKRKVGYGPVPAGIVYAPYPACGDCPLHLSHPGCGLACLEFLKETVHYASAQDIAAVLIEPLLASNIHSVPEGYLRALREWTREHGILLILDEVQSGMGRTGDLYWYQREGVIPDILLLGKALGNGQHIAAILLNQVPEEKYIQAVAGGTGDYSTACAAACAVFGELLDHGLLQRVKETGAFLKEGLLDLQARFPTRIRQVRGRGLALAVQFTDGATADSVYRVLDKARMLYGRDKNALILKPPYSLTREQATGFLKALESALGQA